MPEAYLEKDVTDAHPEAVENLSDYDVVEKALFAIKHLVEYVEQLLLAVEANLGDAVLVLPLDERSQQFFNFPQGLLEVVSLHIDVEHLLAKYLLVFNQVGELEKVMVELVVVVVPVGVREGSLHVEHLAEGGHVRLGLLVQPKYLGKVNERISLGLISLLHLLHAFLEQRLLLPVRSRCFTRRPEFVVEIVDQTDNVLLPRAEDVAPDPVVHQELIHQRVVQRHLRVLALAHHGCLSAALLSRRLAPDPVGLEVKVTDNLLLSIQV